MNFPVDLPPPFLHKAEVLKIFPQDIVEQFVRGGGKGGQKMNKTSSTVVNIGVQRRNCAKRCESFKLLGMR